MKMRFQKIIIALIIFLPVLIGIFFASSSPERSGLPGTHFRKLAVVKVNGLIAESNHTVAQLKSYRQDRNIAGVLLRIESQGGGVAPSQEIYNEVNLYREQSKPLVVSMGNLAASGGYYIAAPAQRIFALPGTVTGSIGVTFSSPLVRELTEKIGIEFRTFKAGSYKDIASPHREMTDQERDIINDLLKDTHEQFIDDIANARGLDRKKVEQFSDGRIFTGRQALQYGLIDYLGGFEDAIDYLLTSTGLPQNARIVEQDKSRSFFSSLLSDITKDLFPYLSSLFKPAGVYYLFSPGM